jgi:hypothetical protein
VGRSQHDGTAEHKVVGVAVKPGRHDQLLEGSDDNGFAQTVNSGRDWAGVGAGDGGLVRFAPGDNVVYAADAQGSTGNTILERSPTGAQGSWTDITPPDPRHSSGFPAYPVFAVNPRSASRLLMGGKGKVWQTSTGGLPAGGAAAWQDITPAGGPASDVTALTYAPRPGGNWNKTAYVGFANGQVWRTDSADGAAAWVNVTPARGWGANRVTSIAADPNLPGEVYLSVQAYGTTPQIWFSNNWGGMWRQITGNTFSPRVTVAAGGLQNVPVRALVVDPRLGNRTIYAGTEVGVYRGIQDAGRTWTWTRLGDNFPNVPVWDLQLDGNLLVAGTDGRGVWQINLGGAAGGGAPAGVMEGTLANGLTVATFTDPAGPGTETVQSIDWGDGTALDTTTGSITWAGTLATVTGTHAFANEGSYAVTVTVATSGGAL